MWYSVTRRLRGACFGLLRSSAASCMFFSAAGFPAGAALPKWGVAVAYSRNMSRRGSASGVRAGRRRFGPGIGHHHSREACFVEHVYVMSTRISTSASGRAGTRGRRDRERRGTGAEKRTGQAVRSVPEGAGRENGQGKRTGWKSGRQPARMGTKEVGIRWAKTGKRKRRPEQRRCP